MGRPSGDGLPRLPGLHEAAQRRRAVLDELVSARYRSGLSQTEVAARMGTSQSVVGRLESGGVDVRLSTLERYATAVGHQLDVRLGVPPACGEAVQQEVEER